MIHKTIIVKSCFYHALGCGTEKRQLSQSVETMTEKIKN